MHISLQHIDKSYEKHKPIIKDVSLDIFEDEFLVLVGPSGSGKTTMLRMIAGLEEITDGKLYINDMLQNDKDPSTRSLSFVFQNYALLPSLTVYENILFGLENLKTSKLTKKKMIESVASKLSLLDKMGSYPHQLSGGQRQRVALARALVDEKKLVLFDEPLSNLDAVLRSGMRKELMTYHKAFGVTSVYVTHDQIEAMSLATRVVVLIDGRVSQVGTPYQLYNHPNNLDVATFIGAPTANVLACIYDGKYLKSDQLVIDIQAKEAKVLLNDYIGQQVYFVIRPKDIEVYQDKQPDAFKAKFLFEENLGDNRLLHLEVEDKDIQVIVDKDFKVEKEVYINFGSHYYLFNKDKQSIRNILYNQVILNQVDVPNSVIRELNNYGYKISNDMKDINKQSIVIEKTKHHSYLLKFDKEIKEVQILRQIFNHIVDIK